MRSGELRLFVSSTFRDLMLEREQLIKKVFPRLRAACRERGIEFTEIDLRWGITEEESSSGKLMRICVEEIDKCRPYIIGIVGSRYGYTPGADAITQDPLLFEEHSWLREHVLSGKSITDVEFTHGMLNSHNTEHAFVYDQINKTDIEEPDSVSLSDLLGRVASGGIPLRSFASAEEFGEQVLHDMLGVIERDFPIRERYTELALARQSHEAFALNRRRSHVTDPHYRSSFNEYINSDGKSLVIWGRSGLGKSSLIASLVSGYRNDNESAFIVEHYVGAGASASDATDVIRHIMLEIKERYALTDELPSEEHRLREEFPLWLAKVQSEKLILVIDALNQLTGVDGELHWLPDFIPANIRLIVSVTPGGSLDALTKRGWQMLEMWPLDEPMRERITKEYLLRYRKILSADQLTSITKSERTSSPIFLRTLLEEIRIFGHFSSLSAHIEHYLAAENESQLFHQVLLRMEDDHGKELVRNVMTSIWASRFGLSESELLEITSLRRIELSIFLKALDYHLMQRGGLYTFFHNYLREAVEARYLPSEEQKKEAHAHLARYFASLEASERRGNEEPWQWQTCGDLTALKECLMRPEIAALFTTDHQAYEAYSYWKSLPKIAFNAAYIEELIASNVEFRTKFKAYKNIINLLIIAASYDTAVEFLDSGFSHFSFGIHEDERLQIETIRAELDMHRTKYELAIDRANDILKDTHEDHILKNRLLELLSVSYYHLGKFEDAIKIIYQQINISTQTFGSKSYETAKNYKNLGACLMSAGKLEESNEACSNAVTLYKTLFGDTHPETAITRYNLGACLFHQNKLSEALKEYRSAETILMTSVGPLHHETLNCQNNIANLLANQGKTGEARVIALNILKRRNELQGEDSLDACIIGIFIGYTFYLEKNYSLAKKYYEHYLPMRIKIQGESHPDIIRFKERLNEINQVLTQASA